MELLPEDQNFVRLGKEYDGVYVLADDLTSAMHVYSFGVAGDSSFEKELAQRELKIFMHDHTIHHLPEEHENFVFRKTGISHMNEPENQKMSLETLMEMNQDL